MNDIIKNKCEEINSNKIIILKEKNNRSKYIAINSQKEDIKKYEVDGCLYKLGTRDIRCDYLLESKNGSYFIELKGSDIKKGLKQILLSISNLTPYFDFKNIYARVVTTKGTKPNRLNTYKEYRDLVKKIGSKNIVLKNTPLEEKISTKD